MCFTKEVSLTAFVINVIFSVLLFNSNSKNDELKIMALFFAFVGLMQLYDYIFWSNPSKTTINKITTKLAMLTNHIQPIVLGLLILFYKNSIEQSSKIVLLIYTVVAILYTINIYDKVNYTETENINCEDPEEIAPDVCKQKQYLNWEWNEQEYNNIIYTLFILALCFLSFNNFSHPLNLVLVLFTIITFFMSYLNYKTTGIGRFWCYFASFIPLILFILFRK
jgi:hypothetical protein